MTPQQTEVSVTTSTTAANKISKASPTITNNSTIQTSIKTTKTHIKSKAQNSNDSVAVTTTQSTTKTKTKLIRTANDTDTALIQQQKPSKSEQKNDGNDNKFLERVFAAMKPSQPKNNEYKPPIPPYSYKSVNGALPNGVVANKTILNGGRPPPHPPSNTKKIRNEEPLVSSKLVSDSTKQQCSKISNNSPSVNGYAEGVSLTTSKTGNNYIKIVDNDDDDLVDETPVVAVTLTLPLSTPEKMSATATSKYNYIGGTGTTATTTTAMERRNSYLINRSPSPASSVRSSSSRCSSISNITSTSTRSCNNFGYSPRRVFPQTYTRSGSIDVHELQKLESSPVIFDGNMSFVLGCKRQPVHQTLRPSPSYMDDRTSSAYLSEKIQNFLRRTDHVQEEWTAMGRRSRRHSSINSRDTTPTNSLYDDYDTISLIERQRERKSMERASSVGRSRSAQNILTKAFQLTKKLPSTPTSRSNSLARDVSEEGDDRTIYEEDDDLDFDEVKISNTWHPTSTYIYKWK